MDILKRHSEFINHLVQFIGYCCLKECLEDMNLESSYWHMTLKGLMNAVDRESLSRSTVHGLKLMKLAALVMAEPAPPDVANVMEILQCFCTYSSPHEDEFRCLYREAKIQAAVKCAEDCSVEEATELIKKYFGSEKVLMKSMLEVVGALQGDKRNAFPSSVQYFLQEHTYEAFHVSVKNFCRGLIFESPEPCLFEFFREHCGEADNTECSSAGAVNAYMPSMTQEVVVDSQPTAPDMVLQERYEPPSGDPWLEAGEEKELLLDSDSDVVCDVTETAQGSRPLIEDRDQQLLAAVNNEDQLQGFDQQLLAAVNDEDQLQGFGEGSDCRIETNVEHEIEEELQVEVCDQVEAEPDQQVGVELDREAGALVRMHRRVEGEIVGRREELNETLHQQDEARERRGHAAEPVAKANGLDRVTILDAASEVSRKLDFSDSIGDGRDDGDGDEEYFPEDTPLDDSLSDPFEYSSEKGEAEMRRTLRRRDHPITEDDRVRADSDRANHEKQADPTLCDLRDTRSATKRTTTPEKQVEPTRRSKRLSRKPAGNSLSLAAQNVEEPVDNTKGVDTDPHCRGPRGKVHVITDEPAGSTCSNEQMTSDHCRPSSTVVDEDVLHDSSDENRTGHAHVVSSTQCSAAQPCVQSSSRGSRLRQVSNKTTLTGEIVEWSSDECSSVTTPPSKLPKALEITRKNAASFNPPTRPKSIIPHHPVKQRMPWTKNDELKLQQAVKRYGIGNWRKILENCNFDNKRTNVDIKDKWRNMNKAGGAKPT